MKNIGIGLTLAGIGMAVYAFTIPYGIEKGTEEYKKKWATAFPLWIAGALTAATGYAIITYKK